MESTIEQMRNAFEEEIILELAWVTRSQRTLELIWERFEEYKIRLTVLQNPSCPESILLDEPLTASEAEWMRKRLYETGGIGE